jgi:hypothetical protein
MFSASKGASLRLYRRTFAYKLISHLSPFCPKRGPLASAGHVLPDEEIGLSHYSPLP